MSRRLRAGTLHLVPADALLSHGRTRIARARLDANLSQDELAARNGLAPRTVERLDRGELDNPGIGHILRLADVLDCSVAANRGRLARGELAAGLGTD